MTLDELRAEIRAITAETCEYMRVLHEEKIAKIDELPAYLQRQRANARRRNKRSTRRKKHK